MKTPIPSLVIIVLALFSGSFAAAAASIPNKFVLVDVTYSKSHGYLIQGVDLLPATGISIGYLFSPSRNLLFGAIGHWANFSGEAQALESDQSDLQLETTLLQMTGIGRLRILKHGFTPYIDIEAGMTFLSHNQSVAPCLAAAVGIQIPILESLDIDFRARAMWSPQSGSGSELVTSGASLGIVYALPRE